MFSFHDGFVFDVASHLQKPVAGTGWLPSGVDFCLSARPHRGMKTQMCFISRGLQFLLVYNLRVATISLDQKRERGFDEQLVQILKFKQKYWAPLAGEMGQL